MTSAPDRLDERSLRRPDFMEGVPIRFGDGQDWSIPRPSVRFAPTAPGPDGAIGVAVLHCYEQDSMIRATVKAVEESATGAARLQHLFALAAALLRVNYDLTHGDLETLLGFDADDPAGGLMLLKCHAVASGRTFEPGDDGAIEPAEVPESVAATS